ncbi:hypothetical protein MNBD_PLANCTO03-21, partial [hydrothermal vent metagenome]
MAEQTRENQNSTRKDQAGQAGESDGCGHENACCGKQGSGRIVGLCCMASGECGIIREMRATGADAAYLRALGLRPNQRLRLCRAHGPWIVEVGCHGGPAS